MAGVLSWVIVWDLVAPQTITSAVEQWLEHPVKRWPTGILIVLTALHLMGLCPRPLDPWHALGRARDVSRVRLAN